MSEHLKEESIIPYLDGRVSAVDLASLDAHVASCAACRERVEELRAVMRTLAEWTLEPPSPAFDAALRVRLAEEEQGSGWFVLRPIYGAALAAAVVIASAVALWPPATLEAPPLPKAPGVAVAPQPGRQPSPTPGPTPQNGGQDALAVLDSAVLLENYDMLTQFDILFEPATDEKEGKTL
ncbi:MAG TPA: zf-HC2 domain-containing protein [Candidatus Xenobia bacterium]|nr:zf-HC2 domain-containing protein [Candidatus Xenobia bacterium]